MITKFTDSIIPGQIGVHHHRDTNMLIRRTCTVLLVLIVTMLISSEAIANPSEFSRSRTGFSRAVLGVQVVAFTLLAVGLGGLAGSLVGRFFNDLNGDPKRRTRGGWFVAGALGCAVLSCGWVGYLFLCDTGAVC